MSNNQWLLLLIFYLAPVFIGLLGFEWSCKIKGIAWDFFFELIMVLIPIVNLLTALKIISIAIKRYA